MNTELMVNNKRHKLFKSEKAAQNIIDKLSTGHPSYRQFYKVKKVTGYIIEVNIKRKATK